MFHLIHTLEVVNIHLDGLRFAGTDQNPHGIRDLVGAAVADARRHNKAAEAMLAALKLVLPSMPNFPSEKSQDRRNAVINAIAQAEAAGITTGEDYPNE
jgi:hypothetical protein